LTSLSHSPPLHWARILTAGLIATMIVLVLATLMLFDTYSRQRALLSASIRNTGWVSYQAQLEFVKARAQFDLVMLEASPEALKRLKLRIELLRSRLPLLYNKKEIVVEDILAFKDELKSFETRLDRMSDEVASLPQDQEEVRAALNAWIVELEPLGRALQKVMMASIAYNEGVFQLERELAEDPAIVPFLLLILTGAALALVVVLESRRDRQRFSALLTAQSEARAMEANLRAAIEAMPAATLIVDPADESVGFYNAGAVELIGPTAGAAEWSRFVRATLEAATDHNGRPWGMLTMGFVRAQGDIVSLRGAVCSVVWEGRPQVLIVLADTSRARAAELQVMQAAKLATLGEMATAIAHELNQPLSVIKMAVANAHRLLLSGAPTESVLAKLDRIGAQVDRAKRITDQVRRYGRMPSDQRTPFPIRHAVEVASGFVAEQYRASDIRLSLQLDVPAELQVIGDQTMFEQVIVNLLVNARDAYESAGLRGSPAGVWVRADYDPAVGVRIDVEDGAGGVPEAILPKIFEPFITTKSAERGTGLGLSVARNVVRDMHGTLSVQNVRGGARFTIIVPVSSAAARLDAA